VKRKEYYDKLFKLKREFGRNFKNKFRTRRNYYHGNKSEAVYIIEKK